MRRGSVRADRAQDRSLSRPPRATGLLVRCAICFAFRRFLLIPIMAVVAVAATPASADTVRQGPAIALPFGDIIIPVPAPPTNADPMNPASPGDVVTNRYNNLRTGTTLHGGLDQQPLLDKKFGYLKALNVDGVVLAQPLYMDKVEFDVTEQLGSEIGSLHGPKSAVFIATSKNWVYAFDADPPFHRLWAHRSVPDAQRPI
jgi:hypothetical protein